MSNIYIQEPPTLGKVLLITTVGDIDVELWSKETPKACRNFIQLCMEGYYDNTIFHRVVSEFIVQGGDPTGTGEGGESIYGEPFKDEIHSRLRFSRRGLLAMANSGKDDNGSQFFFTLAATPELQGKHTIFGKVVGDTIFNMIKLDAETDSNERPLYCHKIIRTEILNNPFPDIVPRVTKKPKKEKKNKIKEKGVKNFKLLSFGEEAQEDEQEAEEIAKSAKIKSSHDVLDDPKLSSVPAVESSVTSGAESEEDEKDKEEVEDEKGKKRKKIIDEGTENEREIDEDEIEYELSPEEEREKELLRRKAEIQKEIEQLKTEYRKNRQPRETEKPAPKIKNIEGNPDNELVEEYKSNLIKYSEIKTKLPLKGSDRETFTMNLLKKFKSKLHEVKDTAEEEQDKEDEAEVGDDYDGNDGSWMKHTLKFVELPRLARDANTKSDDWYDITDPRSKLAKRRREESEKKLSQHIKRMRD